jgi:hypothetical protein
MGVKQPFVLTVPEFHALYIPMYGIFRILYTWAAAQTGAKPKPAVVGGFGLI